MRRFISLVVLPVCALGLLSRLLYLDAPPIIFIGTLLLIGWPLLGAAYREGEIAGLEHGLSAFKGPLPPNPNRPAMKESEAMLTEAQIETAAREYCRLCGVDPDETQWGPDVRHPTMAVGRPRWRFAAVQVRAQAALTAAIDLAKGGGDINVDLNCPAMKESEDA